MQVTFARRLARPVAAVLAAAALAGLGAGCGDDAKPSNTNSSAVHTTAIHTMSDDSSASFDTTGYFPGGQKDGATLMVEAMGPKTLRMSKEAQYTMKVTNLTNMPVRNVMLSSTNPDGFQVTGVGGGATTQPMDKGMGYAIGDLGPGESKTVTMMGMATKVGMVDTCYTATFNPPTLCTMVSVTNPAVDLMVDAPATMDICQPLQYVYTVKNTGTGTAHGVTVHEDLPAGLTTADGKSAVDAKLGDIAEGQTQSATAVLKAAQRGKYDGTAMAMAAGGEAAPSKPTSTTITAPVLTVAVAGPDSLSTVTAGTYKVTVTNTGDAPSGPVTLTLARSQEMGTVALANANPQGSVMLDSIAPGASATADATGNTGDKPGAGKLQATASSACAGQATGMVMTTVTTTPSLLLETVDEHDPVTVGSNVIYDIKVTNQSGGDDNNVAVTATVPDGEQYVSTDGPTQPTVSGNTLTFPVTPVLSAKASITWKVTVKAVTASDVQFKTTAKCDGTAGSEKAEGTTLKAAAAQ